jgi:ATP-binding cassette subfamily C protein LapB
LVTHKATLLALVDRIIVFENGAIIYDGPKSKLLKAVPSE